GPIGGVINSRVGRKGRKADGLLGVELLSGRIGDGAGHLRFSDGNVRHDADTGKNVLAFAKIEVEVVGIAPGDAEGARYGVQVQVGHGSPMDSSQVDGQAIVDIKPDIIVA